MLIAQIHFNVRMIRFSEKIIDQFSVIRCRKLATYISEEVGLFFAFSAWSHYHLEMKQSVILTWYSDKK